ncbi:MAG: LPS assembly protein LptD, partial [Anaerolineae bacterium]|nr:LPS assembly protein LptD [Anaerolineae bacterium]
TTPTATVPSGAIDMGLIFERDAGSYLQTLEPRLYYLYSDFEAQADNPDFDTRELDFSYSQLFRDTRFAGHDRLGDANRLSIGVTSRFIDNTEGREWLSLSLGQIFYFEDRRVHIGGITPEDRFSNSDIATEVQYQPANRLWLTQTLLWDSRRNLVDEGGLSLHYQAGADSLYNVSYRFRRDGTRSPIDGIRDLSQADASMVLPVGERWSVYARYRYDVDEHRAVDDLVGVRYEDCCWAVSLIYQRSFDEEFLDPVTGRPVLERDHTFVLEFQLKGLGNLGNTARNLLIENILG